MRDERPAVVATTASAKGAAMLEIPHSVPHDGAERKGWEHGRLREVLLSACMDTGRTMDELSVLAGQNEPYRLDTPAGHRLGQWLAKEMERLQVRLPIHLRGLHYIMVAAGGVVRPDGKLYINDESNWIWLDGTAARAARWLGYVDYSDIKDERNAPPELHLATMPDKPYVGAWFDIDVRLPDYVHPSVYVTAFEARQPYQLYLIGEKSSLGDVLKPVAERFGASLALPTGEPSATMIYEIAEHMAKDGRPAVVFYFSDCDPSGYQMPISVARKLQAFRDLKFPNLDVRLYQAALTPEQAKSYGLPSTPLKDSERRADRWQRAFGIQQTEIDALAALRPDLLRTLAIEAIAPFYDETLRSRCTDARYEYQRLAEKAFEEQTDAELLDELRARAEMELDTIRERIESLREEMRSSVDRIDLGLSDPVIPEPIIKPLPETEPIYSSSLPWAEATRRMCRHKAYINGAADAGDGR